MQLRASKVITANLYVKLNLFDKFHQPHLKLRLELVSSDGDVEVERLRRLLTSIGRQRLQRHHSILQGTPESGTSVEHASVAEEEPFGSPDKKIFSHHQERI